MFNPLSHPACYSPLLRLAPSTWIGHTPFAMFLTELLKPEILVELGTYYGTSYCAFCQAVEQLKLDTKCYAVDTWRGDSQSGTFGDEVLNDLREYHDHLYGRFSRLIQSTFEEALVHFEDGSIDLLHIDGFHTYDAVKKDFRQWLPKISERGVVLFHDINVREKDFGVRHFWDEIKPGFPNFEFVHSHGLGVLAVGEKCPSGVTEFIRSANDNASSVRDFFYQLGLRFEVMLENQDLRGFIRTQDQAAAAQREELQKQIAELEAREPQLEERNNQIKAEERSIQNRLADLKTNERELEKKAAAEKLEYESQKRHLDEERRKIAVENQELFAKRLEVQKLLTASVDAVLDEVSLHGPLDARLDEVGLRATKRTSKCAIGIVTFNNPTDQLDRLAKSIELAVDNVDQMDLKFELHLVDNGLETFWPETALKTARHESTGNVGFGRSMNRMMDCAFSDPDVQWFLCLNPDGILHYKAINELMRTAKSNPLSLIEARQFPEEHLKDYDSRTLDTDWASGACLLIPRDLYNATKGFDPNFFMYLEDVDLSWRVRSAGFSVKICPNALFGHEVLDRVVSPGTDMQFLLSGRYLAHKWCDREFLDWTEKELVVRGYFDSSANLPELPEMNAGKHLDLSVADFGHYFHFSQARW